MPVFSVFRDLPFEVSEDLEGVVLADDPEQLRVRRLRRGHWGGRERKHGEGSRGHDR